MPYTIKKNKRKKLFKNAHKNYAKPYNYEATLFNDDALMGIEAYNDTTEKVKILIQFSIDNKLRMRPYGSKWSLSTAPYSSSMLLDYSTLKYRESIAPEYLRKKSEENEYLFAQSGNIIEELSMHCLPLKRSLKTSGASNGQTIAGAISTGVHGSAFNMGAIQDFVVGLHIVVSGNQSVYLEAKSNPVIKKTFADKINAKLIRDDELFHSALVSLGAFGFIHGVMIQTVELFEIRNYVKKIDKNAAFRLMDTLDFENSLFQIEGEFETPYHFKLYINQYDLDDGIISETMFTGTYTGEKFFGQLLEYFKDIPKLLGKFTDRANCLIPILLKFIRNSVLPKEGIEFGYLNDIFGPTKIRGSQFSTAFSVPLEYSSKTVKMLIKLMEDNENIPSIFSTRFVKKSKATLAFTKFDMNCVIGLDGLQSDDTMTYIGLMHKKLDASKIPYAFHWGKVHNVTAKMVDKMYKEEKPIWLHARRRLLSKEVAEVFTNEYLETLGLDKYEPVV